MDAIKRVFNSDRLLLGDELKCFEDEFSSFIGVDYGIGCDNATNGLFLALKALNIGHGDKVLTVSNTAIPTVSAIVQAGAEPVFCDVDDSGQMDIDSIELGFLREIKAVIVVHLFGFSASLDHISKKAAECEMHLIEDCSQAHGAEFNGKRVGSFGELSVFSFYPTKPLGGFGDAGMILTSNKDYAERLRRLRFYGVEKDYYAVESGYNSRMDEIHAAILRDKLSRLSDNIQYRSSICEIYRQGITHSQLAPLPYDKERIMPSNYLVPFIYKGDRDAFASRLAEKGVLTNISYKYPIHTMSAYTYLGYEKGALPKTEYLCDHIISLPLYDNIDAEDVDAIIEIVNGLQDLP